MNNENLNKSIILIGPKGVGKSLIAEKLKERLKQNEKQDFFLLKLDLIRELCKECYENPNIFNTDPKELERKILQSELSSVDPKLPNYEEIKKIKEKEISEYVDEIFELNQIFGFSSFSFSRAVSRFKQVCDFQEDRPVLSDEGLVAFDNLTSLEILDACMKKIDRPLLIDAGGSVGAIIDGVLDKDKSFVFELKNEYRQKQILSKIGNVVYLIPGADYDSSALTSVSDSANIMYRKNPNSYRAFANITVDTSNLFFDRTSSVFTKRDASDIDARNKRLELLNNEVVDKICNEIVAGVKNNNNQFGD